MAKIPKRISASEILEILDKNWLDTKDIKLIGCVSFNKARDIKKEIMEQQIKDNIYFPNGLISSEKAIEYFNINIQYLQKISEKLNKIYSQKTIN